MRPSHVYLSFVVLIDLGMSLTFVIYGPFLLSIGLQLSDITLINLWFFAAILLGEIPTGIFADHVGRGRSVWLGAALLGAGSLLYATAHSFTAALIYELVIGFGSSWISGACGAWVRDAMEHHGEGHNFEKTIGTAASLRGLANLVGGSAGVAVGTWIGFRAVWVVSGIFLLLAFLISFLWMGTEGDPKVRETNRMKIFTKSVNVLATNQGLLWITAICMAFGLILPFNHYWTPFFIERIGEKSMWWLWIVMYGSLSIAGIVVRKIRISRPRETAWITTAVIVTAIGLAALGSSPLVWVSISAVCVHEVGRGLFNPLVEIFTQRRIESSYRATYSSLQSLLTKVGFVFVLTVVWWWTRGLPTNGETISTVWQASGSLLALAAILFWLFRPHRAKEPAVSYR